jgi:hypothetical protein
MAADWIKMRVDLYRDPKVCVIADELMAHEGALARYVSQNCQRSMTVTRNVTRNATVGALVTVWGVMRHRGKRDGNDLVCRNVRLCVIDDVCDLPGFGEAMAEGGWVIESAEGIVFPGFFDEYNVDPNEKKASAAAERQRRYRERKARERGENRYVTRDVTRDVTVTHREEKRREEKKKEKKGAPDGAVSIPDVDPNVVADFLKIRKAKRAPLTETALAGIQREAAKAGVTLEQALRTCCERGWSGFKADWVGTQAAATKAQLPGGGRREL